MLRTNQYNYLFVLGTCVVFIIYFPAPPPQPIKIEMHIFIHAARIAVERSMTRHRLGNREGGLWGRERERERARERETWFLANKYMHAIFCSCRRRREAAAIWGKVFAAPSRGSRGRTASGFVFSFIFILYFVFVRDK